MTIFINKLRTRFEYIIENKIRVSRKNLAKEIGISAPALHRFLTQDDPKTYPATLEKIAQWVEQQEKEI